MAKSSENAGELERSVGVLYENLLRQRQQKQEEKQRLKAEKKAALAETVDTDDEDSPQLSKAEKKKKVEESWRNLMTNLTGDDLEYSSPKKGKRKKYRKWIGEDENSVPLAKKPKKKKKVNYSKEFEQELGMLKQIVAEQNRFTHDLGKRFQVMVGPATKDAGPLSKTAVELAVAINSSRMNSLSMIREIGGLKKTVAQLTQKEREIDKKAGGDTDSNDLALIGSGLARDIFGQGLGASQPVGSTSAPVATGYQPTTSSQPGSVSTFEEFDPAAWNGSSSTEVDLHTKYENIPTETMVELNSANNEYRFKTVRTDTMEEIQDYPNPTFEVKTIDRDNGLARDSFDTVYPLAVI